MAKPKRRWGDRSDGFKVRNMDPMSVMEPYIMPKKLDVVEKNGEDFIKYLRCSSIEEAREIDDRYEIGDIIEFQVNPGDFGRIAAQTARQVVVQRIREAERGMVYDDFISIDS